MKKILLFLLILLCMSSILPVFAEHQEMLDANTDAEIKFNDFEWYSDYSTVSQHGQELGWYQGWDFFPDDGCQTPHWTYVKEKFVQFADGSESKCGGSLPFVNHLPKVGGYELKNIELFFMWNLESDLYENYVDYKYRNDNNSQLYMALYTFDIKDCDACYSDLVNKLKSIYGNNPYEIKDSIKYPYTLWINADGASVSISNLQDTVRIGYMAPGSEERLCAVEDAVKLKQINDAVGDISGL